MVDHNRLTETLKGFGDCVEFIVDHHKDERLYVKHDQKVIKKVGSCSSLVLLLFIRFGLTEHLIKERDILFSFVPTILMDTYNFDTALSNYKEEDTTAFNFALQNLRKLNPEVVDSQKECYEKYLSLRQDIKNIPFSLLLQKDLKVFKREASKSKLKVSCLPVSSNKLQNMFGWDHIKAELVKTCDNSSDFAFLMTISIETPIKRELIACFLSVAENSEKFNCLMKKLRNKNIEFDTIDDSKVESNHKIIRMQLRNSKNSRKIISPLLVEALCSK